MQINNVHLYNPTILLCMFPIVSSFFFLLSLFFFIVGRVRVSHNEIKGYANQSKIRTHHVNKGKVEKGTLKVSVDTMFYLTQ